MDVLLSIKPRFAEAIAHGKKRYELRKSVFRTGMVERVYLYATAPVSKIVGSFRIGNIIQASPVQLWAEIGEASGISYAEFLRYFGERDKACAMEIKELEVFNDPIDPRDIVEGFTPPQTFRYIQGPFRCPWPPQSSQADKH